VRYLPILLANLFRKKARTVLTAGSFAVALFLFCLLVTIRAAFHQGVDAAGADRLLVINKTSLIQPLPLAYREKVERVPGVLQTTFASWFGGVYQDERNFFAQFAIDPKTYRKIYTEFEVPEDQWKAFEADRAGCVVGAATAKRFGFEIGDRVPIQGAIYPGDWEFNVRGIYTGKRPSDDLTQFWFHWEYLDEVLDPAFRGYVGWYTIRIAPGSDPAAVSRDVDGRFANSPWETRTQPEAAFMASFVEQMGNIELLMISIGGIVVFTLLLVTGNTMATAVRERGAELAVLKTVGFSDRLVMGLILIESLSIAAVGGGIGVLLAKAFTLRGDPTGGMLATFYLPWGAMSAGFAIAILVGAAAALLPAVAAMRLRVVAALRKV
jgi:putative ABC transport system permease protein